MSLQFIVWERALGLYASGRGPAAVFVYEFLRFGLKQAWACLFGGAMLALLLISHLLWPDNAPFARYDFLTVAALLIQLAFLLLRLETKEEALVICLFHVTGTIMEVFKRAIGSVEDYDASAARQEAQRLADAERSTPARQSAAGRRRRHPDPPGRSVRDRHAGSRILHQ